MFFLSWPLNSTSCPALANCFILLGRQKAASGVAGAGNDQRVQQIILFRLQL